MPLVSYSRLRGHSLLEMIIASFAFAVVAIGVVAVWASHLRVMSRASGKLMGQFLAKQQMEECLAAGFDGVDTFHGIDEIVTLQETVRDAERISQYRSEVKVTPRFSDPSLTDPDDLDLKEVVVTVSWRESGGKGQLVYTSLVAKNGTP